jgi:hypothetical protein
VKASTEPVLSLSKGSGRTEMVVFGLSLSKPSNPGWPCLF